MNDQIINAEMAQSLYRDATRTHPLSAWLVMQNQPEYPGQFIARLLIDMPSPYVLIADTLDDLRDQLPLDVIRSAPQPTDPPGVVEIWYAAGDTAAVDR